MSLTRFKISMISWVLYVIHYSVIIISKNLAFIGFILMVFFFFFGMHLKNLDSHWDGARLEIELATELNSWAYNSHLLLQTLRNSHRTQSSPSNLCILVRIATHRTLPLSLRQVVFLASDACLWVLCLCIDC